jgi:phage baseplate assembly protein W
MATTRNTRQYSDLNLLFSSHPITGDVTKKTDEEAVKSSLRNLISTKHYERPFHPEIGCQIYSLLFENFNPVTKQVMMKTIFDTIQKFEPRATVLDVKLRERIDQNDLSIDIIFKINNSERPITLTTFITRVR